MATIAITAANVLQGANSKTRVGIAATTLTAGQLVAKDGNGKIALFDADGGSPTNIIEGYTLDGAAAGQPVLYTYEDDDLQTGGTHTAGQTVIGSATAGAICPDADATTGWRKWIVGEAKSTTKIIFRPLDSGVTL